MKRIFNDLAFISLFMWNIALAVGIIVCLFVIGIIDVGQDSMMSKLKEAEPLLQQAKAHEAELELLFETIDDLKSWDAEATESMNGLIDFVNDNFEDVFNLIR